MLRRLLLALMLLLGLLLPLRTNAQTPPPAEAAETLRNALIGAQLQVTRDPAAARSNLDAAATAYATLADAAGDTAPDAAAAAREGFADADAALAAADTAAFAGARAQIWAAVLRTGVEATEAALHRNDAAAAKTWLAVREFRHATKFSRPNADATLAVNGVIAGTTTADAAIAAVHADLLDTYQGRLNESLGTLASDAVQAYPSRRAEQAALAQGYFQILAPAYLQQHDQAALAAVQAQFVALRKAAMSGQNIKALVAEIEQGLQHFRAAPLSAGEQTRRAGQMMRFLALVPVEYERGVRDGKVFADLEIREATTFFAGASAAFDDLRSLLEQRDPAATATIASNLDVLGRDLAAASATSAVDPSQVQQAVDRVSADLRGVMPEDWQRHDSTADFDVIETALDQMENAAAAGEYELAESARLEAYAILESGPEAKLIVFAPEYKPVLEGLFWNGQGENKGLAALIEAHAPLSQIKASRAALSTELAAAQKALSGNNAPTAVATNAAVIVFREGLEAVLILASLMGSLKFGAQRALRKPLWSGALLALVASALVWVLAQGLLAYLVRRGYHETLEAVVSLIAIAVLLLITNWFFHDVYWKDWMSSFHQQKRRIITGSWGQWVGLALLGFSSVFREGFETVLFLQALVLEAGLRTVLGGVGIGMLATLAIGLVVFVVQAKLPHKKMLIVTGVLIVLVLVQMVGNTVNIMQVIGWMPLHPIRWLAPYLPYWTGMWFGLYATWEGILLQAAAGIFTVGSYFVAEYMTKREQRAALRRQMATQRA